MRAPLLAAAAAVIALTAFAPPHVPATPQQAPIVLRLLRMEPPADTTIARSRLEVSATFSEPVSAAAVRVALDERDVTREAFVSEHAFSYAPLAALEPGAHVVAVTGKTREREPFRERWSFVTERSNQENFIDGLEPPSGTVVGRSLLLGALTKPRARIRIVALTSATVAAFTDLVPGSLSASARADERGYFETRIQVPQSGSGILDVRVASSDDDGNVAVRTLRLRQ